jgi:SSS family solute:Na+ symporter
MGRRVTVAGGLVGVLLAIVMETVIGAVGIFYSLLVVTLFVPVVGGLYVGRAGAREALAAIIAGVTTLFAVRLFGNGSPWFDPTLMGICAAATVFLAFVSSRNVTPRSLTK